MPSYYLEIPVLLRHENVQIQSKAEFYRSLGRRSFIFHKKGGYYDVRRHGQAVVKTSLDSWPIMDEFYRTMGLRAEAEKVIQNDPDTIGLNNRFGSAFNNYLLRAHIDWLHFQNICKGLPSNKFVDESIFLLWGEQRKGAFSFHEAIIQPFVPGTVFGKMIDYPSTLTGKNELFPPYRSLKQIIGPQMRDFLECDQIDFFPMNFVLSPDNQLVYIDIQPITDVSRACNNRNAMDNIISSWGY